VIGRLGIDLALIEQVAGHQHEIDLSPYGITLYNLVPGTEEIECPIRQVVPLDPEMYVRYVKKSRHT
jgi:hypothetical protein